VAGPVLLSTRSADVATVELTVEELLPLLGSLVVLVTFAMLEIVEPAGALAFRWRIRVKVCVAPAASGPMSGGPESCENDTSVALAGGVSLVLTFCASDGPLLVVVIV